MLERAVLPSTGDAELVRQALAGSQDGYRELVLRHQRPVFGFLLRMVGERALAEDLAQETFVKAFRALPSFDPARRFSSWLFKIAHNTALDHLRRRQLPTVPLEPRQGEEGVGLGDRIGDEKALDPELQARSAELARDLEASVEALDPIYREPFLLRYQVGSSLREIEEITGLPSGTVKVRLHRARKLLARALEARGWGPGG